MRKRLLPMLLLFLHLFRIAKLSSSLMRDATEEALPGDVPSNA